MNHAKLRLSTTPETSATLPERLIGIMVGSLQRMLPASRRQALAYDSRYIRVATPGQPSLLPLPDHHFANRRLGLLNRLARGTAAGHEELPVRRPRDRRDRNRPPRQVIDVLALFRGEQHHAIRSLAGAKRHCDRDRLICR